MTVVVVNHAALLIEICAPYHSETRGDVFLRSFLELSSCTIMGAGGSDAIFSLVHVMLWLWDKALGSIQSLRTHSEDCPKHRKDRFSNFKDRFECCR